MIIKFDPRKEIFKLLNTKLPMIEMKEIKRGKNAIFVNPVTGNIYGTLIKIDATNWEIKINEMYLDKKTLTVKIKADNYGHNILPIPHTIELDETKGIAAILAPMKKYFNMEKFIEERKTKMIALFEKTFA